MLKTRTILLIFLWLCIGSLFAEQLDSVGNFKALAFDYHSGRWVLGANALYLKPSQGGSDLGFFSYSNYSGANTQNVFYSTNGAPNNVSTIQSKWDWGVQLKAAYNFAQSNDILAEWYYINDRNAKTLPVGNLFAGSFDGLYAGYLKLTSEWSHAQLEFGKLFSQNKKKLLRLHAGAAFVDIHNVFTNFPRLSPTGSAYMITTDNFSFVGAGPRLGINLEYDLYLKLGFYAKAASALLLGTIKQNSSGYKDYNATSVGLSNLLYSSFNLVQSKNNMVIPEFDARFGVQYGCDLYQTKLTLDVGYLWFTYLNAIQAYTGDGIVLDSPPNSGAGAMPGSNKIANYSLNGLYFGLVWNFDT